MRKPRIARDSGSGLLAIAVLSLSAVATAAQEPAKISKIYGLMIPARVGGLAHGPPIDYETKSPGLGHAMRFFRPGWTVDVYIYDFQLKAIPDDIESAVVKAQFANTKGDIFELGRQGKYANVKETGEFKVGRAGKTRFACATFSFLTGERKERDVESYLCLTSWDNKFVKIRMTAIKGTISRAEVTNFVGAWSSLLSPSL